MIESWHSYPKILALGHAGVRDLLLDPVLVEEKVDGSQFSFGKFPSESGPYLRARSRGGELNIEAPEKMFAPAIAAIQEVFNELHEGWTYRGECLTKSKHNVLAYDRMPKKHVILFDINTGQECYTSYEEKAAEAERLGFEVVPRIHEGKVETVEFFRSLLDRTSILGGQKIEGVVIKNYSRFGRDGKALMGKFVSEAFKEVHNGEWKKANPDSRDMLQKIIDSYKTPARWNKAIQHQAEAGALSYEPKDIGPLILEVRRDLLEECQQEMMARMWEWGKDKILRACVSGIAEHYKGFLLRRQFEQPQG